MDILNLPNLKITRFNEDPVDYYITVESIEGPRCCQACGVIRENNLSKFGRRKFTYQDLPIHAHRVTICVERQRYKCLDCKATFFEDLPMMDTKRNATKRLIGYIQRESLNETFVDLADRIGLDEKTIRNIFGDYVNERESNRKVVLPSYIGIDEVHLIGKPRCVITNLENNSIIDMLPNRDMKTLDNYFAPLNRSNIKWVAMDMWTGYKSFVYNNTRHGKIVIDKFHVVKMADYAMEQIRKKLRGDLSDSDRKKLMRSRFLLLRRKALDNKGQQQLNNWLSRFPALASAYFLKEFFYDIYDAETKDEAIKRFNEWKTMITDDVAFAFNPLTNMVHNWYAEIFNYWECPCRLTNAYTESLNSVIRFVDRKGRGYSFDVLRAKMLYADKSLPEVSPLDKAKFRAELDEFMDDTMSDFVKGKIKPTHIINLETKTMVEYRD